MNIYNKIGTVKNKNILLFQGCMGKYFDKLDKEFQSKGANTFRLGLNGGDAFFSSFDNFFSFRDKKELFFNFAINKFKELSIDMIFIFGDCRYYQERAIEAAKQLDIKIFVFEEGYLRPNFITLEKTGVNANSLIPRKREFYDKVVIKDDLIINETGNTFFKMAYESSIYYLVSFLKRKEFPNYQHHRSFNPIKEGFFGFISFIRKFKYKLLESNKENEFKEELSKKYFFVPLQTFGDFQIVKHSKYNKVEDFIFEVLTSFSSNSSKEHKLVFKHHPVDRGRKDYSSFINKIAKKLGCLDRIIIVFDVHLPTILKNAIGTIVVNSTVGLSSIYHSTPTICLGDCIYDIEGLTSQEDLKYFFSKPSKVDSELFDKYRYWLIKNTQLNSNFYL
ncbi:capsular biosynthesis protein [bacterium]|jgi:capsular polysaccharide export protein|nr:capsular biosynthesis protein [bacterium]